MLNARLLGALIAIAMVGSSMAAFAVSADSDPVLTPILVAPTAAPNPVLGVDGRIHLAYELALSNQSPNRVTIESVEVIDATNEQTLEKLEGPALQRMLYFSGGAKDGFGPGAAGYVFMDVQLAADAKLPTLLAHRFQLSMQPPASIAVATGDQDPTPVLPIRLTFTGAPVSVGREPAVVISPPLKGARWVVGSGCCDTISSHRGAMLSLNGSLHVAERFAIDFVQLNDDGKFFSGPEDQISSYPYFGAEIYSVADGVVVATQDGNPEEVPGALPKDMTAAKAGGNHVVVDIGGGRYAFYAHLQPGSLRVKEGDRVARDQVLALLGNTGNTTGPHLHFHVMDSKSPLQSNGLPFMFDAFTVEGVIANEDAAMAGGKAEIEAGTLAGPHRNELPLNLEVVSFP